jgi:hypothetical protein
MDNDERRYEPKHRVKTRKSILCGRKIALGSGSMATRSEVHAVIDYAITTGRLEEELESYS